MSGTRSDAVSVFLAGGTVKLSAWVEAVRQEGWEASAGRKGARLQEAIEALVAAGMGRRPGEPKRAS